MACKKQILSRLLPLLCTLPSSALTANHTRSTPDLLLQSTTELEQQLVSIDHHLASLASYSIRSGTGAIGYRSRIFTHKQQHEWLEIKFTAEVPLEEVILVPVIRRDTQNGFQADGFPEHFRLIAGNALHPKGIVIAEYSDKQHFLPRVAPLSIPCHRTPASWIRIETEQLSLRAFDEAYVFQLSEILAFSGTKNVARHRPVLAKTNRADGLAWDKRYLVDGFVPYLMDAAVGEKSIAFISRYTPGSHPSLTLDLGAPYAISDLHLHAVDTSDVLPQALPSDFGIPHRIQLEGALLPDFSDAVPLLDLYLPTIYDMGPIIMRSLPEATNRYFRFYIMDTATDPRFPLANRFGFAEIELLSHGKNRALHKSITGTELTSNRKRPLSALLDGHNMFGTILPIKNWLNQLSQRHELERMRPRVVEELNHRYDQQKNNLRRMGWLSALLAAGIGFTILIDRLLQMRKLQQIEQRIAADLHDELGANLHTIGLLSDLADEAKEAPEELGMLLQRIRSVTERSGVAVRNCTKMHNSDNLYKGLIEDMQRTATRILDKRDHSICMDGEKYLKLFNQRTCFGLFLFYKECLVNISRHSCATHISTQLQIQETQIDLTVTDNGQGLSVADGIALPPSLKRRARLLGAKLTFNTPESGGTCIHLKVPAQKWRRRK